MFETKRQDDLIKFEAEIIDNERSDISITITLDESVNVTIQGNKFRCEHLADFALDDLSGTPLKGIPGYPVDPIGGTGGAPGGGTIPSNPAEPYNPADGGIVFIDINTGEAA